jgi:hypothetical protein
MIAALRNRVVRYILAVVAFIGTGSMSVSIGVLSGAYVATLGFPLGRFILVSGSMVVAVLLPAYIVKKLLIDYW